MTPLYFDVHFPAAIADQLRRRGVDVLTAQEDGAGNLDDGALLARSTALGRVCSPRTFGSRSWQRIGIGKKKMFAGLLFGHQLHGSVGQYVRDLELIAKASDPDDWVGQVEKLPFG